MKKITKERLRDLSQDGRLLITPIEDIHPRNDQGLRVAKKGKLYLALKRDSTDFYIKNDNGDVHYLTFSFLMEYFVEVELEELPMMIEYSTWNASLSYLSICKKIDSVI